MFKSILQVYPEENYQVYLYFNTGEVRLFDASEIVGKGVFKVLADKKFFVERCTVLNHTLAWDVSGNYDPTQCLDLDPEVLYEKSTRVEDPLAEKNIS